MQKSENQHVVLISGKTATGKSSSLRYLTNPEGVVYLNCENNKPLPFQNNFKKFTITHPLQVYEGITWADSKPEMHTIVIDSLSYLMDLYETGVIAKASNTQKAWGDYRIFFKNLMSIHVAGSKKNFIFLAHTTDIYNENAMAVETFVKIKGSVMNQGVESYF